MGGEFPHFSVPAFESHAFESRQLAGFETITYAPIGIRIDQWLDFANKSRGWLDESKDIFDELQPGQNRSLEPPTPPLEDVLWQYDENLNLVPRTRNGLIVPSLHTSPPPVLTTQHYQNVDMFSDEACRLASLAAVQLKNSVFSKFDLRYVNVTAGIIGAENHELLHGSKTAQYALPHSLAVHRK